jgi:hypothetical protein
MNGIPPGDDAAADVRRALLRGGELPAGRGTSGFIVGRNAQGLIAVCWRIPRGQDDGARLGYLESYAAILRGAGIRAFVTLAAPEARVLCLLEPTHRFRPRAVVDPGMEQIPSPHASSVMLTAGRILDIVASGHVLEGTLAEVGQQIGTDAEILRVALRELRSVGWVAVQTQPFDRVAVRLERRLPGHQEPIAVERRQRSEDAWPL